MNCGLLLITSAALSAMHDILAHIAFLFLRTCIFSVWLVSFLIKQLLTLLINYFYLFIFLWLLSVKCFCGSPLVFIPLTHIITMTSWVQSTKTSKNVPLDYNINYSYSKLV
jgi:hypothetical protein